MQAPFRLDGKTALVTGGASGIGEATCRALANAGAAVVIADVDRAGAEALSRELPGSSVRMLDITDEMAVDAAFAAPGRLDILINNAGIGLVGNIEETALVDFERLLRVNVIGMFLVTRAAMPKLLDAKGAIVNIGSVAGLVGIKRRFAYCASKGAVVALTRQVAVDYAGSVRVELHLPGHGGNAVRGRLPGKISQAREGESAGGVARAPAGGAHGPARGDRESGAVFVLGRSRIRYGLGHDHRRRLDGGVAPSANAECRLESRPYWRSDAGRRADHA